MGFPLSEFARRSSFFCSLSCFFFSLFFSFSFLLNVSCDFPIFDFDVVWFKYLTIWTGFRFLPLKNWFSMSSPHYKSNHLCDTFIYLSPKNRRPTHSASE